MVLRTLSVISCLKEKVKRIRCDDNDAISLQQRSTIFIQMRADLLFIYFRFSYLFSKYFVNGPLFEGRIVH